MSAAGTEPAAGLAFGALEVGLAGVGVPLACPGLAGDGAALACAVFLAGATVFACSAGFSAACFGSAALPAAVGAFAGVAVGAFAGVADGVFAAAGLFEPWPCCAPATGFAGAFGAGEEVFGSAGLAPAEGFASFFSVAF
ncbi:MAG: hypothetical protein ACTH2H_11430 [Glutamicibacter sp.]